MMLKSTTYLNVFKFLLVSLLLFAFYPSGVINRAEAFSGVRQEVVDDPYEDNDEWMEAYDLSSYPNTWLSEINGYGMQFDEDWYQIYVPEGYGRIIVYVRFTAAEGDIDLELREDETTVYAGSYSSGSEEHIDYVTLGTGVFYLRVFSGFSGWDGNGNQYDLWWNAVQPDDAIGPTVDLISPDGDNVWEVGSTYDITWSASDDVEVDYIGLQYSINGGTDWINIEYQIPNSGSYSWLIPDTPTELARVKVIAYDTGGNSAEDISTTDFIIFEAEISNDQFIPLMLR